MKQRLTSLDAFRGLTIAGMILVNNRRLPPDPASLTFALANVAVWLLVVWGLYRRRLFVKV